jgi:ribosomal protein S6--L-glutamate ligase
MMSTKPYFVSLHPGVFLDENLSTFVDLQDSAVQHLVRNALGVVLPGYLSPRRYAAITRVAQAWFPRLDVRIHYLGKTRQVLLFRQWNVRHPETLTFTSPQELLQHLSRCGSPWGYPLVMKGDLGGGGVAVFPVHAAADAVRCAAHLPADQPALLQRWVDHGGKDLRVVVYGDAALSYFRVGADGFYNNVCRGGRIDYHLLPDQQAQGVQAVREFCRHAGIDVAGFDLMFPDAGAPVFVEINHHFGRKGIGGTIAHRRHFQQAVDRWCAWRLSLPSSVRT